MNVCASASSSYADGSQETDWLLQTLGIWDELSHLSFFGIGFAGYEVAFVYHNYLQPPAYPIEKYYVDAAARRPLAMRYRGMPNMYSRVYHTRNRRGIPHKPNFEVLIRGVKAQAETPKKSALVRNIYPP